MDLATGQFLDDLPGQVWWNRATRVLLALFLFGVALAAVASGFVHSPSAATRIGAGLALFGLAALGFRRRAPVLVLTLEVAIAVTSDLIAGDTLRNFTVLAVVIALYTFVTTSRTSRCVLAAAASSGLAVGLADLYRTGNQGSIGSHLVLVTAVAAVGFYVRSRQALLASYRERAEQAEREQQWRTARAVEAERVRIARDLHDVVAHHVSLLVVQAGAVRETLPPDHVTRPVLDSMIDGGRHAMTELRDMLDALRLDGLSSDGSRSDGSRSDGSRSDGSRSDGAGPDGLSSQDGEGEDRAARPALAPQPTAEDIPSLVAGACAAGLPVDLGVDGRPGPLTPTASVAAYRIVQEALTNVVKHAPGAPTSVRLHYGPDRFVLTVRNPCPGLPPAPPLPGVAAEPAPRGGYGIVGMRERATMAHGSLVVGPVPEGWELRAELPMVPAGAL